LPRNSAAAGRGDASETRAASAARSLHGGHGLPRFAKLSGGIEIELQLVRAHDRDLAHERAT